MDLSIIAHSSKTLMRTFNRNSPTILTALGVAGLISTVILAIKATPKAMEILDYEEKYRTSEINDPDYNKPIDIRDKIVLTWKCYIPTFAMGASTIICMIGSNSINMQRNAALASLFSITETALKEYQAKVSEMVGEKKAEKIQGEIMQDHLDANPVDQKSVIITGNGDYLCYDNFSGRYFRSNIEALRRAENMFNQRLLRDLYLPINDFYYEIGLESIDMGAEMGWIAERNLMELKFTSKISTNQEPCLVMDYRVEPNHI